MDFMHYCTTSCLWFHTICIFYFYILERSYWLLHLVKCNCNRYKTVMDILSWLCRIHVDYVLLHRAVFLHCLYCLFYPSSIFGIEGKRVFGCPLFTVCLMNQCYIHLASSQKILAAELQCLLKIVWYSLFIRIKSLFYISNVHLSNMYLMKCSHYIYYLPNSVLLVSRLEYIYV